MPKIYHFITESDLDRYLSDGQLILPSLSKEGFIHCSTLEQVRETANGIMPGREDLQLLEIDEAKVIPTVKYESEEGGLKLFPHIYGPLNEDAIIAIHPFPWHKENGYILPVV